MRKVDPSIALSQELVVGTALSISRRSGDAPGMRELAAELAVTPGALYRHVDGQPQLIKLMIEAVMNRVAMPTEVDHADPWQRIKIHVRSLTEILDENPGLDGLIAAHGDDSGAARLRQRWFVAQLRSGGLSAEDARRAYGVIYMYWLGSRQPPKRFAKSFWFGLDRLLDGLRCTEGAT